MLGVGRVCAAFQAGARSCRRTVGYRDVLPQEVTLPPPNPPPPCPPTPIPPPPPHSPLNNREKEEGEASVVTVSPLTNEISLQTTLTTASLKRSKTYTFDKARPFLPACLPARACLPVRVCRPCVVLCPRPPPPPAWLLTSRSPRRACVRVPGQVYGQYSTQQEVFTESIVPIINEVMLGFNWWVCPVSVQAQRAPRSNAQ
jgi:hypothetical protein